MPGIAGHYAHVQQMTFGLIEIEEGTVMPVHQHVHEQITYCLQGQLDMDIGGVVYSNHFDLELCIPIKNIKTY